MIFFSDLDRTLIYSKKFITNDSNEICIEVLNGEEISYISQNTINILNQILLKKKFIPATTRSIEQYTRINFKENDVNFDYSIVTNGGNILHKGRVLEEWSEIIKIRLKECERLDNVIQFFHEKYLNISGITKIRSVDDMFFYIVVDRDIFDNHSLDEFEKELKEFNWKLYISGRKIYFIPSVITKEAAIEFLLQYLGENEFGAMGDSIMDLNMLLASDKAYVPANSYVSENSNMLHFSISDYEGFKGTEQILKQIVMFK